MNYDRVSATIGTRAVDPRTGDDNPVLKQMVRFRSNLQEQLSVMDAKLDSLLDMATNIQLLISKMNKERGLVENVVAAYPQITTRFGEKNQLPVPSSVPIATAVSDSVTFSDSVELMNKDTIQPKEKFEAKSETQQKSEIESGASPIVPEGAGRIVTVLSKETGNSDFELESSKNNVDKFGFGSELSKNNNAQEVFDGLTNWDLKPPEEVAAFVDSKKDIYAHMKTDLYRVSVATSVEDFGKKCNEAMQVFDPGGSALDVRVLKVGDSLLEVFYASWLRIKWDSKKIYDWVWQSLFICSYVWQHNLLKCSGMNREIVLCIVTSKSNIFGLVGSNICWFKTTCLVLCFKNLLAVTPHARTRRICFYTFMELTVWKWLKDGNGTCLQIHSLSLARLCEICDSLFEMLPTWNKHLGSDNLERIIDDCRVAKYFLELQFKMGNSRAVLHLYCLISLELKKLIPLKTLLWLDWLLSAFRSQIYPEVYRIFHSPDLANLMTLDFESLKGGSSSLISFSNVFIGCSGSFGETIIFTSIEAKGQGVSLEFIISFGSRELNVGVGMMTESLIKQRGDHSTMSRVSKVDKMLDRPSAKPPFQFRHLSLGDKTLSRGEYCHGNGWFCIRRRVLI